MELAVALSRLGLLDQYQPTAQIVVAAFDEQMAMTSPRHDLARQRLAQARDRVLQFTEDLFANEQTLWERMDDMRVLTYADPMSMARAFWLNEREELATYYFKGSDEVCTFAFAVRD
jgi:hypothetical protein